MSQEKISNETITQAAKQYFAKLDNFVKQYDLPTRQPATLAWKTTDITEFTKTLGGFLRSNAVDQCHIGFVDKRYIASIVFKKPLYRGANILKLMQRRPGSTDPVGFDHADFMVGSLADIKAELSNHPGIKWGNESNEIHGWVSVWFNGTEAKFVDHVVLDVGVKEMRDISKHLGFTNKEL